MFKHLHVALISAAIAVSATSEFASAETIIAGWGWSDNIGWISLNCADRGICAAVPYGLSVANDGTITGYAWSENIGWVSAQASDLVGCPSSPCGTRQYSDGSLSGWLRALANGDGWNGYISLSGPGYGVGRRQQVPFRTFGWAWSDMVIGWIKLSPEYPCASTAGNFCVGFLRKSRTETCVESTIETCNYDCQPANCIPPPPPTSSLLGSVVITATPRLVRPGESSVIDWNVTGATTCNVSGNGNTWTIRAGPQISNPVTKKVKYVLSCSGPGGSLTGSVDVAPTAKFQEF